MVNMKNTLIVSTRSIRKNFLGIKVYLFIFTRFRDTSQKFNDMRMSIEFLHQLKFGQQVLPIRLRSVICKIITHHQLLPMQVIAITEPWGMLVDILFLNKNKWHITSWGYEIVVVIKYLIQLYLWSSCVMLNKTDWIETVILRLHSISKYNFQRSSQSTNTITKTLHSTAIPVRPCFNGTKLISIRLLQNNCWAVYV